MALLNLLDLSPLNYRIDGRANAEPRLVLLHPVGLDLSFFDPLVEQLARKCRILRVDLRGHGGSPSTHPAPRLEEYVDDIHALLARLEYTPAVVVGFSFGGMLAQVLALRHAEDVCALVISACPSTLPDASRKALAERGSLAEREGMAAVISTTLERWFSEAFLATNARARILAQIKERLLSDDVRGWAEAWRAMSKLDTAPYLPSIKVPVLCIAAEQDRSVPPQVVESIAKAIPGACFIVIPDTPHMLFIEQPLAVAAAISGFLDGLPWLSAKTSS